MTTRFIIPAAPSLLPPAPSLSLLPFSLGPPHAPYTDNHANTSQYFQPRPLVPPFDPTGASPAPHDDTTTATTTTTTTTGSSSGKQQTVQATFRGRLVIGQYLSVPPAYRGIILSTSLPPNKGGTEHHPSSDTPLTPCASTHSAVEDTANGGSGGRPQRESRSGSVARIKGAGQIALSRPRTRRTAPSKKRTLLDSDDDGDDGDDGDDDDGDGDRPSRTPKRVKTMTTTPKKNGAVPEIVIQEPTPLKQPLSTRFARGGGSRGKEASPERVSPVSCSPSIVERDGYLDLPRTVDDTSIAVEEVKEPFIPSPEMENDSPVFSIPSPSPLVQQVNEVNKVKEKEEEEEDDDGPVRILYPKAQFQGFMLYTGDSPLVGFRADELEKREQQVEGGEERKKMNESQSESQSQSQAQTETSLESDPRSNINLRPSWWRQGGAGEGGDEFVRGMGEWLGLVQVLNKTVYLEGLDVSDDDDE
ncbi:hypothetical protein CNBG_0074 [Cryptococcus deuterogattii R265]|uniref:Uncharacterized protein n=1 Tax=Cryptococcus deuterogattii (strain R265) TaxID=294750 RepID=A0A095CY01_CRYD2|nr:hypothetical protein CNBG_0074 [Cryptococcus deuterogattii R265]KIR74071.1 hypothetical protein I310_01668 [Cryptococcus deuterogattii CA1014]